MLEQQYRYSGQQQMCAQASRRLEAQATDTHPAGQTGRTEWQTDANANRCEQIQINTQPDYQIARYAEGSICKTTRLPNILPDTLPDERADRLNSEQADLQNRWISRQINAQ